MADTTALSSSQIDYSQRTSKYTWRHLQVLGSLSPPKESPLRVVSLCDLDCFYAQVEGVRLRIDPDEPLAVSQWGGLIAINYPARKAGITRFENAASAAQKCPGIRLVHVQTWKEGDTVSKYHDEPTVVDHKVSLDPYRRESRRILQIFKKHCDQVEKASIDESFLDLSSVVREELLERYGDLLRIPHDNLDDPLPEAPSINWSPEQGVLVDLDSDYTEEDATDWDDVAMHIAADFMRRVRQDVKDTLGYTCSAGIARNKTLAKIAAGQNKPAKQTILRNRAVQSFINGLEFTKIRNLGGKFGAEVSKIFETSSAKDITAISIEDLRKKLGTEAGQWLYNIVRGIDYAEVSTNTQVKSMLSAKSFRPQIDSIPQAERWIKVLTADLASRLLEDPNQRRPKTLTMHHRVPGTSKTRQAGIPRGAELNNEYLATLAMKLLHQINTEGRAFPCFNLSLGLSGFEGLESGVQDIGGYFKKSSKLDDHHDTTISALQGSETTEMAENAELANLLNTETDVTFEAPALYRSDSSGAALSEDRNIISGGDLRNDGAFRCPRCTILIVGETEAEHSDWHFAKDLSRDYAKSEQASRILARTSKDAHETNKSKATGSKVAKNLARTKTSVEKGQKRLKFG